MPPPQPATLVLKVEGAFALEVEMASAQILERINAIFGWRCVGKLRLRQGPVRTPSQPRAKELPLDGERAERLATTLAGVRDEELRASLERLGRSVLAQRKVT